MGLLYPGVDDEDVMQWYLNTHYLDGILDYQPQSSSGAAYKSAVDDWIPYFNDMMDDWTPSSEPTPIGDWFPYEEPYEEPYEYPGVEFVTRGPYDEEAGKYTSETPIGEWEITEPLVSYFKPILNDWDLTTISKYNMDYNDSQGGYTPYAPPGEIPSYLQKTPDQQDPNKLHDWGPNPWPEYADAEGYAEEAIQPFSRGPDGITPVWSWEIGDNDGLLGIAYDSYSGSPYTY